MTVWEAGGTETLPGLLDQNDAGKFVSSWKPAQTSESLEFCTVLVVIDDAWKKMHVLGFEKGKLPVIYKT